MAFACVLLLTACATSRPRRHFTPLTPQTFDPYQKALQEAVVRQHLGQLQKDFRGYRIGVHDVIEVHVFEYEKMNTVARVGENGCISLPPLGEVKVAGLTERQLEAVLQDRLRGRCLQDPHVTVLVKEPHAMEVAIVGEVNKPGHFSLLGEKNLLDLLAMAGGMTEKAGNVAYLIRKGEGSDGGDGDSSLTLHGAAGAFLTSPSLDTYAGWVKIDLEGLLIRGEQKWNVPLKSGDLINVPEAGWVHVTGRAVEKPGTYPLTRAAKTLCQMIDEAGGLKWEANKEILIIRKEESGKEKLLLVDYRKALTDTRHDISMCAGDTIIAEATPIRGALASVGRVLQKIVHAGIYASVPIPIGRSGG
ncbi:MAG: polysaccharide export protein [Candidatus Sumerlaeia bacterium]|nr:polysaccharide export protein [Candidatus Sumerlaeia bacterium]